MQCALRAAVVLALSCLQAVALAADIDGRWLTVDSDTGHKRSIVEIKRVNNQLRGRIVEIFVEPGETSDPICARCSGERHNQAIRGMEILLIDAVADGGRHKGTILDPEDGRIYKCLVSPDATGKMLSIRGYAGIPAFGRTVVWTRAE